MLSTKKHDPLFAFVQLVVIGAAAVFLFYITVDLLHSDVTPAPNYQAQNLEKLKSVKPEDLVVCIKHSPTRVQHAFLIDQNHDGRQTGRALNEGAVGSSQSYDLQSVIAQCEEVQVVHPPFSFEVIGQIVTYGLNPDKPAQAN